MKQFYEENQGVTIGQEVLAQLPWYHNLALMEKINNKQERAWYAEQTIKSPYKLSLDYNYHI